MPAFAGRTRAEELVGNPITHPGPNKEEQLGSTLFESIAHALSWYLDEGRRQRLLSLCIDEDCRRRWMDHEKPGSVRVSASGGSLYGPAFSVAQYTFSTFAGLKEKLTQFPPGTTFQWCVDEGPMDSLIPEESDEIYSALVEFLTKDGHRIAPSSALACRR
jgi:hypothetical protein